MTGDWQGELGNIMKGYKGYLNHKQYKQEEEEHYVSPLDCLDCLLTGYDYGLDCIISHGLVIRSIISHV